MLRDEWNWEEWHCPHIFQQLIKCDIILIRVRGVKRGIVTETLPAEGWPQRHKQQRDGLDDDQWPLSTNYCDQEGGMWSCGGVVTPCVTLHLFTHAMQCWERGEREGDHDWQTATTLSCVTLTDIYWYRRLDTHSALPLPGNCWEDLFWLFLVPQKSKINQIIHLDSFND